MAIKKISKKIPAKSNTTKSPFGGGLLGLGLTSDAQGALNKIKGNSPQSDAQRQLVLNQAAAKQEMSYNRPDITSAFDTQKWTTGPDGRPQLVQELNTAEQGLLDRYRGIGTQAGDQAQALLKDPSFAQALQADSGEAASKKYFDAGYSKLNPIFQQRNRELEQQLADTGAPVGSELYNERKKQLLQEQDRQILDLQNQAEFQGAALAGQNLQNQINARSSNLGSAQGLFGLVQPNIPQVRNFANTQINSPDYAGLASGQYNRNSQESMAAAQRAAQERMQGQQLAQNQAQFDIERMDAAQRQALANQNAKKGSQNQLIGGGLNLLGQLGAAYISS